MISYLKGSILLKKDKFVILEVNNIGYTVFLSKKTLSMLPAATAEIKLFCFHDVKETASDLYGFLTYDELDFFETLNDIRGIGPKIALEISTLGSLDKIKTSILAEDTSIFKGIPGIGSKKAMTIILELTGKIQSIAPKARGSGDETENALMQLGFSRQQAKEALGSIDQKLPLEEKIKQALKMMGK